MARYLVGFRKIHAIPGHFVSRDQGETGKEGLDRSEVPLVQFFAAQRNYHAVEHGKGLIVKVSV